MRIDDDGTTLTILSEPWLIAKVFAVLFAAMSVIFPLVLVGSLLAPPRMARIECSRARGSCELALGARTRTVALDDIVKAEVVYRRGTRNSSASHHVEVRLRGGESVALSESSYHDAITAGFRAAAGGLNGFLSSPSEPTYAASYRSSDTDWVMLVLFALITPLTAWVFLRLWVSRRTEVSRARRSVHFVAKHKLAPHEDRTVAFSDVSAISLAGQRYVKLSLRARDGDLVLVVIPKTPGARTTVAPLVEKLSAALGVPVEVSDEIRAMWGIGKAG